MAGWGDDPEFCKAADWSGDLPHGDREKFFHALIDAPPHDLIRLAAVHEGAVIGYVDLSGTDPVERELGFVIGDRMTWGRGLGRLAAAAGCRYGFVSLGLRRIWAEAHTTNVASVRVLQTIGMHEVETEKPAPTSHRHVRHRRFQITAEAWDA